MDMNLRQLQYIFLMITLMCGLVANHRLRGCRPKTSTQGATGDETPCCA